MAKQKASPREALGEVEAQPRLSCEDKDKMSLSFGSSTDASREADLESQGREFPLTSHNPRALIPNANSVLMGGVKGMSLSTDSFANTTPVPEGTIKVLSREARTGALCSAKYLRSKAKCKAPLRAKGEVTMTLLPKTSGAKFALRGAVTNIASSGEVNTTDKVIFKSLVVKNRSLNARVSQTKQPNTQSP